MNFMKCLRCFIFQKTLIGPNIRNRALAHSKTSFSAGRPVTSRSFKVQENLFLRSYENSFQSWILRFFKEDPNYKTLLLPEEPPPDGELSELDLPSLLHVLSSKKSQEALTPHLLREIDVEIAKKINHGTPVSSLMSILQIYMDVIPIQAYKLTAFSGALWHLERLMKNSALSSHDIVQAAYYASHLKSGIAAKRFMEVVLFQIGDSKLEELDTTDLGLLCVSFFRCAVAVNKPEILQCLAERFKADIASLIREQPAIFISFVKCFRISKHYDQTLCSFIASQGLQELCKIDIVGRIHLGIYFTACRYGDTRFIHSYLRHCVEELSSKIRQKTSPRMKDIGNLVWSCGSYNLEEVNRALIASEIPKYVCESMFLIRNDVHTQISILLWLWACECRLEESVSRHITMENIKFIKGTRNFKSLSNLHLLLTCVNVESPGLLKTQVINSRDFSIQPKFDAYLRKRPKLNQFLKTLQQFAGALKLDDVRFGFKVPHLYIGGILAEYHRNPVCFEVIDDAVCLANSDELSGRMKLKLRLLEKMNVRYLKVSDIANTSVEDLKNQINELFPLFDSCH